MSVRIPDIEPPYPSLRHLERSDSVVERSRRSRIYYNFLRLRLDSSTTLGMTYKDKYLFNVGDTYGRGKPLPQYDVVVVELRVRF